MRVAAIQHDVVWEDRDANFAHLDGLIGDAAQQRAQLVVLSEMFSTGFSMDTERVAEPFDGPSSEFLVAQATRRGLWVCGSAPEVQPGDTLPSNTLLLAGPDGAITRYRKIHPFSYGGEHEKYAAGDEHVTVEVEGVRCTLFVCYDLRFADEFWATAHDTDCYVVVANWPAPRRDHWRTLLRARAIENQAFVVGVNRIVERPAFRNGAVVARKLMNLSSSFDHRVVDGMDAARFIQAVRALLEQPALLFVE